MVENTDEEHLDKPITNQLENSLNEFNPTEFTEITKPKEETETMEVHAHDLHKAPGHGWKHYIFEFLMLFLAVFCGFLAENIRENQVEHQREKEYMTSLYQDLKTDTLNMSNLLKKTVEDISNYDSLFDIFKNKKYLQETSSAYFFGRKVVTLRPFYPTDGTITQLENSGGLRLIRSRAIVDSLQSYKLTILLLKNTQDFEREHFMLARSSMGKIFNADVFDLMMGNGNTPLQRLDKNYPLMPYSKEQLNDFHIPMNFIRRNKLTQTFLLKGLQKKASDLMKLLKEKYKVDQE
jgi:hypothetical protein